MEWMNETFISAIIGLGSAIATGVGGYLVAKRQGKTTERELLSKDEQAFRSELRAELQAHREEVKSLRQEIMQLREANVKLELENQQLIQKVDQLTEELRKWKGKSI